MKSRAPIIGGLLRQLSELKHSEPELFRGEFYAWVGIPAMLTRSEFEM